MKYRNRMPGVDIFMGLGATIDFEAGTLKRSCHLAENRYGMAISLHERTQTLIQALFHRRHAILLLLYLAIAWNIQKSLRQNKLFAEESAEQCEKH